MLSLEHFLYSKFQNVGAVFLQTSLGLAITLSNSEDVEQTGKEFPSILQVMSILAQSRQMKDDDYFITICIELMQLNYAIIISNVN